MGLARRKTGLLGLALMVVLLLSGCAEKPLPLSPEEQAIRQASITRGGRLYDNWYEEKASVGPRTTHRLYPTQAQFQGSITWRCKECHGWDGYGRNGIYRGGPHYTFIQGVEDIDRMSDAQVKAKLRGGHRFNSLLLAKDETDLIRFMREGVVNMDRYIDRDDGRMRRGNVQQGAQRYQALCESCHGSNGIKGPIVPLGMVANREPWQTLHRILHGRPGIENKPAMFTYGVESAVDILAFLRTLPAQR
ncbi:cytochrome c [Magnetococcus sp. PR-3]|uniref:cytochrome c n=1 Tax=Magnetococcus sp. PR-3 TaxID=3120355 RepID=UPI002FCE2932